MSRTLKTMLEDLSRVTAVEQQAKETREGLEIEIALVMREHMPTEGGAKTFETDGFKFEVKTGYRFIADLDGIAKLPFGQKLIRTSSTFDATAYKRLWEFNRADAETASKFVTASPAKPSVKIKEGK
jgi:hypothetical protein